MTCLQGEESSNCFTNNMTSETYDDNSFFQCLWNNDREPTDQYVFFLLSGSATILLNFIVLVIAFLYVDTKSKPNQIFVINMTVADLLVGFLVQLSRPFAPCFPSYFCGPYYIVAWTCQMLSVFHLLLLNLDKLLSIRIPLRYEVLVTRKRVITLTIISWVVFLIISMLSNILFLQFRDPQYPSCVRVHFNPEEYYACLVIIAYVAPIAFSFAISVYNFIIALASSRTPGSVSERQRRMLMQKISFVFSCTIWTLITCVPYRIGFIIYTFCLLSVNKNELGSDSCIGEAGLEAMTFLLKLLLVSTIGKPIITMITQHAYSCRVFGAWRWVAQLLHLPRWCYLQEQREIITEARSTKLNSLKNESQALQM